VNFNLEERAITLKLPPDLLTRLNLHGSQQFSVLLTGAQFSTDNIYEGVPVTLPAMGGFLLAF
jgi:hypothetical protein